jgi:hypothetical protein
LSKYSAGSATRRVDVLGDLTPSEQSIKKRKKSAGSELVQSVYSDSSSTFVYGSPGQKRIYKHVILEDQKKKIILDRSDRKEKTERKDKDRAIRIIRKKDEMWADSVYRNKKNKVTFS